MKYLKTILIVAGVLVLISLLTFKIYYNYDLPQYSGSTQITGLVDTVDVFTDDYGVPHIYAKNNEDLFFASGYIIARERLFQLSLLSSIMNGNISSLLGDFYNEHDRYLKRNDLFSINENTISIIDEENIELIGSYCSGINTYIDEIDGALPISFKISNSTPIKWTTRDAINVLHIMTDNIALNYRINIVHSGIRNYFGEDRLEDLLHFEQFNIQEEIDIKTEDSKIVNEILGLIGASGSLIGSEAMLIPSSQTASQKPILLFQDIWGLQQPAKWYNVHLSGGDYNIQGSFIPGFPLPLVGKSSNTTWAFPGKFLLENINVLFDLAKNDINIDNINNEFFFADTSGLTIDNSLTSKRLKGLNNLENLKYSDLVNILADSKNYNKSATAKLITGICLNKTVIDDHPLNMLLNWDGEESANSAEALLINTIYKKLIQSIFKDELSLIGDDVYETFLMMPEFAEKSLLNVLNNSKSSWLDDINTIDHEEDIVVIVQKAFNEALIDIKKQYGNTNWQWGEANQKTYKHILGNKKITNFIHGFNIGPFLGEGSISNNILNEFNYANGFQQISGIVLQTIYDLSDMSTSYSIIPTGQSGLPKSPNYSDQIEIYSNKSFRKTEFVDNNTLSSDKYQKIILYPSK